ncbi:MAG TPA: UMP kinase [Patescibacteria group bacterium]|nr:UMP kinase [Patescibacteria group bacterium]
MTKHSSRNKKANIQNNIFVISLGGSLLVPNDIDTAFISNFVSLMKRLTRKGFKFILIAGGGKLCRTYQSAAKALRTVSDVELDAMGIATTKVNAELLRIALGNLAQPAVYQEPQKIRWDAPIAVAGGWKPGRSTDDVSIHFAKANKISAVVNLSNIEKLYTADPKVYKNAKPIDSINWNGFIKTIGTKRIPGGNYPFDPVAAKSAKTLDIKVYVASGQNLTNLYDLLHQKPFQGTVIN